MFQTPTTKMMTQKSNLWFLLHKIALLFIEPDTIEFDPDSFFLINACSDSLLVQLIFFLRLVLMKLKPSHFTRKAALIFKSTMTMFFDSWPSRWVLKVSWALNFFWTIFGLHTQTSNVSLFFWHTKQLEIKYVFFFFAQKPKHTSKIELATDTVKRAAIDPIKLKVQRQTKEKLADKQAIRKGLPLPDTVRTLLFLTSICLCRLSQLFSAFWVLVWVWILVQQQAREDVVYGHTTHNFFSLTLTFFVFCVLCSN